MNCPRKKQFIPNIINTYTRCIFKKKPVQWCCAHLNTYCGLLNADDAPNNNLIVNGGKMRVTDLIVGFDFSAVFVRSVGKKCIAKNKNEAHTQPI